MKRVLKGEGYTIIEVMIVLAISSALLASALLVFRSQEGQTEFSQAIRDTESQIDDIANDISTGYYPNQQDFKCDLSGTGILITPGGASLGTNGNCIFIGKVLLFSPDGTNGSTVRVYTIAGRRLNSATGKQVSSIQEATPVAIANTSADYQDIDLGSSVKIAKVTYQALSTDSPSVTPAFGVFSTLSNYNTGGSLASGSISAQLAAIQGYPSTFDIANPSNFIHSDTFVDDLAQHKLNPKATDPLLPMITTGNVTICLLSQTSSQRGIITISGSSRQLATTSHIEAGTSCP